MDLEQYRPALMALARSWTLAADVEDAVQEAILDFLTVGGERGEGALSDLTLSLSTVCGRMRSERARTRTVAIEDWSIMPLVPDVAQAELSAAAWERWSTARLTRLQRATMTLSLEGVGNEEIAERLCLSLRTVQHHLQGCRAALAANVVDCAEFRSAEEMFDWCAEAIVYRSPRKVGTGLSDRQRQSRG